MSSLVATKEVATEKLEERTDLNSLLSLLYVSTAVRAFSPEELEHFLSSARGHNRKLGVSGLLLYADGNFMQYLEGSPSNVGEIYQRIKQSRHHKDIIEVFRKEVKEGVLGDWSMAYLSPKVQCFDGEAAARLIDPAAISNRPTPSIPLVLLSGFWGRVKTASPSIHIPQAHVMPVQDIGFGGRVVQNPVQYG